jgi:hypothetical protein
MKVNPYLDVKDNQSSLLISPYRDSLANLKITFDNKSANISLVDRIKHFAAGCALFIPIVNIISYIALDLLFTKEIKIGCQLRPEHMGIEDQTPSDKKTRVRFNDEVRGREFHPEDAPEDIEKLSFTKPIRKKSF